MGKEKFNNSFLFQPFNVCLVCYTLTIRLMKTLFILFTLSITINNCFAQWVSKPNIDGKCGGQQISNYRFQVEQSPLMDKYDVKFYKLDIALERTSTHVQGNVTINAQVTSAVLDTFAFELNSVLTVDSVKINNLLQPFIHNTNEAFIPITQNFSQGDLFSTVIYYHGNPPSGGFFSGISHGISPSWGNEVVWTLSESFNANDWFPCKQVLTDKADSVWVFVTTDSTNKVGSNGLLTAVTNMPNNKKRYEWKSNYPIAYYLISASVAKYVDYSIYAHPAEIQDSVLIQNYVYDNPQTLPYFQNTIQYTKDFIELFSNRYGIYPFWKEKYGHTMAKLSGGMEHQTMTTLGYFDFDLISHELGHQWFGDNVTCKDWSNIWINEGFATFSELLAKEHLQTPADVSTWLSDKHSSVMSAAGGSVYIPAAQAIDENRIFDSRLSYDKGGSIIEQIRFELQDDALFFKTLRNFQEIFKDSIASGDDFRTVLETNSGRSFNDFFAQWFYGEGYPTYHVLWNQQNDTLIMNITQTTSSAVTPLFTMLMQYKLSTATGDTSILLRQTANLNSFKIYMPRTITGIVVDPNDYVINKVGTIAVGTLEKINDKSYFSIYPNPATDKVQLNFASIEKRNIIICDISGRVAMTEQSNNQTVQLDISNLTKGIYFIRIRDSKCEMLEKIVID